MDKMENRHSSPSPKSSSPRPNTHRKRSNSLPIVDALGCSTPEAELILAEGRAAVRSRHASVRRRGHRTRDGVETFNPRHHLKYLESDSVISESTSEKCLSPTNTFGHSRIPSDATDGSTSTIVAETQRSASEPTVTVVAAAGPLGDYSANLAKFIQSQLASIPSYKPTHSSLSPCSCPDLSFQSRSPPLSPTRSIRRPSDAPRVIEIPRIRPPLKSAFSAWSSTDEDADNPDEDVPPLPSADPQRKDSKADHYTPSLLRYYENSNNSSFLLSSTPMEEENDPDTAKGFSFPNQPALVDSSSESFAPSHDDDDDDYPSSALSAHPQLTSSSAPSFSSTSTGSYFEFKRPISLAPQLRDRIIAAVTPPHGPGKIIPAISPFEGGALANVHDVLIESQQRVLVDGMSFDMLRDFTMPEEGLRRVTTPC